LTTGVSAHCGQERGGVRPLSVTGSGSGTGGPLTLLRSVKGGPRGWIPARPPRAERLGRRRAVLPRDAPRASPRSPARVLSPKSGQVMVRRDEQNLSGARDNRRVKWSVPSANRVQRARRRHSCGTFAGEYNRYVTIRAFFTRARPGGAGGVPRRPAYFLVSYERTYRDLVAS